jgi:hypothetical protein
VGWKTGWSTKEVAGAPHPDQWPAALFGYGLRPAGAHRLAAGSPARRWRRAEAGAGCSRRTA